MQKNTSKIPKTEQCDETDSFWYHIVLLNVYQEVPVTYGYFASSFFFFYWIWSDDL